MIRTMSASRLLMFNGGIIHLYRWQNTRQSAYNALVTGDLDILRVFYPFYKDMIPIVQKRFAPSYLFFWDELEDTAMQSLTCSVAVEYNNISGAVWPESTTQFGLYNPNDFGTSNLMLLAEWSSHHPLSAFRLQHATARPIHKLLHALPLYRWVVLVAPTYDACINQAVWLAFSFSTFSQI